MMIPTLKTIMNRAFSIKIHLLFAIIILMLSSCNKTDIENIENKETAYMNDSSKNPAIDVIMSRKSVRNFTKDTVTEEDLMTILKAGMAAPTAVNKQPWSFIVVTDRKILDKLGDALPYAKMIYQAPAAIIVCAHPEWAHQTKPLEYAVIDCSCASENILLAVEALGLGAVWTAAYPREERMKSVREICGIPENVIPLNVIPIGHPTGEDKPKDKYKPDRIHYNRWNP